MSGGGRCASLPVLLPSEITRPGATLSSAPSRCSGVTWRRSTISLRAELAYVLRESLRFACFGERPDYLFHAPTFTDALQFLITRHAHDIVGLPSRCAVGALLSAIAKEGGVTQVLAAEHFQHVVEIYIAGHYLLALRLDAEGTDEERRYLNGWTLAQAMAGTKRRYPDAAAVRTCLQAFSLAALFHDLDHLFLTTPGMDQSLALGDPPLAQSLQRLSDGRRQAAQGEAQSWVAELLAAQDTWGRRTRSCGAGWRGGSSGSRTTGCSLRGSYTGTGARMMRASSQR